MCINLEAKVTSEDIDDIMVSALEGGINYWCGNVTVVGEYLGECSSEQISRGGSLILYDAEDRTTYVLTKDKFIQGLRLYLKDKNNAARCYNGDRIDPGQIDGEAADSIIQLAIFKDVVYG